MAAVSDPNPSIGPPNFMDKLQCLILLPIIPVTCLRVLLRRVIWSTNNLSFKADFICSLLRAAQTFVPISLLRALTKEPESKFPLSQRFVNTKSELYQEVSTADFSGRWICKGCPGKPTAASKVDLVILYVHGGAYQMGHPASAIAPFLRIAEIADKKGISVAVFALDYSLTPEAQYPTQVIQAKAAYNYLLNDQHIDHSKISMLGDSAGAHLILNLLCLLANEKSLPKPEAGAFLVAPWIDLRCSKDGSFVRNKNADYLVRDLLITAGEQVMPRELDTTASHIINFSLPRPNKQSWADILPSRVWVGIGSNDTLLDDAVAFVDRVKADGVQVDFEIDDGRVHDWHIVEDVFDTDTYFAMVGEVPRGMMKGAAMMARAVLSTVSR